MDPRRSQRVTEALREELGEMISYELSDPRLAGTTVTNVHVSPDMKKAKVQVSVEGGRDAQDAALAALEHARHYLKTELGRRLTVFRVPELHFEAALSPELEQKMAHLLKRIRRGRPRPEAPGEKNPVE